MLFMTIFNAKKEVTLAEINKERAEWQKKGRDKKFNEMCGSIKRYEVLGTSPLRIFFIVECSDPRAINLLTGHFSEKWTCETFPIVKRDIVEAMQDTTIICG